MRKPRREAPRRHAAAIALMTLVAMGPTCVPKPELSGSATTTGIAVLSVDMEIIDKINLLEDPIEALLFGENTYAADVEEVRIRPWGGGEATASEAILLYDESFWKSTPSSLYLWSNVPPGRYQVARVRGVLPSDTSAVANATGSGTRVEYEFTAPRNPVEELAFTIEPGKITYFGKVIVVLPRDERTQRRAKSYHVEYDAGLEKKAFERMIKSYGDTEWGPDLRRRLAELEAE